MPAYAPAPMSPPYLMGLANFHNQVIPLFDLARSAGADGDCPYALVTIDERGEYRGLSISSAVGVLDLQNAKLAEDQPEPRSFAMGLYSAAQLTVDPKSPPVHLIKRLHER